MGSEEGDIVTDGAWYARWFGEDYLSLYPYRDEEEARRAVDLVLSHVDVRPGGRALDLACGGGRHLAALREKGLRAHGLDLSMPLLRRAYERVPSVVRADMRRLPFADGSFDLVTNFFTSFGYFPKRAEDARVVDEVRRVLRPGGAFLFDFLNAEQVRKSLHPHDEQYVNDRRVVQSRRLLEDGHVVEKRIEIHSRAATPRVYHERVRLYDAEDLVGILADHRLETLHRFGDYTGSEPAPEAPRVILIGRSH